GGLLPVLRRAGTTGRRRGLCRLWLRLVGGWGHRLPGAIVPLRPSRTAVLVDVAVVPGIDVAALRLDCSALVPVDAAVARALRAGGRLEGTGGALGVASAPGVHRLVDAGEGAGTPAGIRVPVLVGRTRYASARIVVAGVGGTGPVAPGGTAAGIAAVAGIVGGKPSRAAVRAVDRAA